MLESAIQYYFNINENDQIGLLNSKQTKILRVPTIQYNIYSEISALN